MGYSTGIRGNFLCKKWIPSNTPTTITQYIILARKIRFSDARKNLFLRNEIPLFTNGSLRSKFSKFELYTDVNMPPIGLNSFRFVPTEMLSFPQFCKLLRNSVRIHQNWGVQWCQYASNNLEQCPWSPWLFSY